MVFQIVLIFFVLLVPSVLPPTHTATGPVIQGTPQFQLVLAVLQTVLGPVQHHPDVPTLVLLVREDVLTCLVGLLATSLQGRRGHARQLGERG